MSGFLTKSPARHLPHFAEESRVPRRARQHHQSETRHLPRRRMGVYSVHVPCIFLDVCHVPVASCHPIPTGNMRTRRKPLLQKEKEKREKFKKEKEKQCEKKGGAPWKRVGKGDESPFPPKPLQRCTPIWKYHATAWSPSGAFPFLWLVFPDTNIYNG